MKRGKDKRISMRFNSNLVPRHILSCATIRRKGVTAEAFYRIKNSLLYVSCSGSKDKATMPEPVSKAHQAKNFAHPRPHHPDGWVNNTASDNHIQKPALAQLILQLISISEADNAIQVNQARPHRLSRLTSYKPHLSQYIYKHVSNQRHRADRPPGRKRRSRQDHICGRTRHLRRRRRRGDTLLF